MAETKEEIAADRDEIKADRDRLQAEVENLRGQLAASGVARGVAPVLHRFELSEGARQELEATGYTNVGGRRVSVDEIRDMLPAEQSNVEIDGPEHPLPGVPERERTALPGIDFVYPSVAPGVIDPAVAGTPGISGPAAERRDFEIS